MLISHCGRNCCGQGQLLQTADCSEHVCSRQCWTSVCATAIQVHGPTMAAAIMPLKSPLLNMTTTFDNLSAHNHCIGPMTRDTDAHTHTLLLAQNAHLLAAVPGAHGNDLSPQVLTSRLATSFFAACQNALVRTHRNTTKQLIVG